MKKLSVESSTFENNQLIPTKYTCDGDDISPPLTIEGVPEGTKTLARRNERFQEALLWWALSSVWNAQVFLQSLRLRCEIGFKSDFKEEGRGKGDAGSRARQR